MLQPVLRACLAALTLTAHILIATPAAAQQGPYTTVACSENIRAVGRPAVRSRAAVESAIDSYDAEARRLHGARTGFSYRMGEALAGGSRLSLTCRRQAGRHVCEARGRTCAWTTTRTPTASVASRCPSGYTHYGQGTDVHAPCGWTERGEPRGTNNPLMVVPPRSFTLASCPAGYAIDPADHGRCLWSGG